MKKARISTPEGQIDLMRESMGQPTEFPRRPVSSGFTAGEILEHRDLNLRHTLTNVTYLRDGKPEGGNVVIVVKHRSGVTGEWLARDFQSVKIALDNTVTPPPLSHQTQ